MRRRHDALRDVVSERVRRQPIGDSAPVVRRWELPRNVPSAMSERASRESRTTSTRHRSHVAVEPRQLGENKRARPRRDVS